MHVEGIHPISEISGHDVELILNKAILSEWGLISFACIYLYFTKKGFTGLQGCFFACQASFYFQCTAAQYKQYDNCHIDKKAI